MTLMRRHDRRSDAGKSSRKCGGKRYFLARSRWVLRREKFSRLRPSLTEKLTVDLRDHGGYSL
jgi:hypothetical protein